MANLSTYGTNNRYFMLLIVSILQTSARNNKCLFFICMIFSLISFSAKESFADNAFDSSFERNVAIAIRENFLKFRYECDAGCRITLPNGGNDEYEFKPLLLSNIASFQVTAVGSGGSGGSFFAIFSDSKGDWKKVFEWQGGIDILSSRVNGYSDIQAGRSRTRFSFNGDRYVESSSITNSATNGLPSAPTNGFPTINRWNLNCNEWSETDGSSDQQQFTLVPPLSARPGGPLLDSFVYIKPEDRVYFLDNRDVLRITSNLQNNIDSHCRSERQAGRARTSQARDAYKVTFYYEDQRLGGASVATVVRGRSASTWVVLQNDIGNQFRREVAAQQQAQLRAQAEQEQRARLVAAKQNLRRKFVSENGVEEFINIQAIAANPFVVKGKITAVQVKFARMLSENEAIFSLGPELFVRGVPSTLFRGDELVVLAVRIQGTRALKVAGGEVTLPYGDFIGAYKCLNGCTEFYD